MTTRRIRIGAGLVLASAVAAVLGTGSTAAAAPEAVFATLKDQGFAPVATVAGQPARFANLDANTHQIMSVETDANGKPLFWSDVLGIEVGQVYGIETLDARPAPYEFYCPYHEWMTGQLVVSGIPSTR